MTQAAAIYRFLNSFGIPVYPTTSVPDNAEMPYMTYDLALGSWGDGELDLAVNVWYRTESEAAPNAKVTEISKALFGGRQLACDGGSVWIKKGEPWCQAVEDEDNSVKRRMVNLVVEPDTLF